MNTGDSSPRGRALGIGIAVSYRPSRKARVRDGFVESPMRRKPHVGFGGRAGEIHRSKDGRALRPDPYSTREAFFAGITANPTGAWITRAARNLFIAHSDRLEDARALVRDRGSQFIDSLDEVFHTEGFKILKTPARTPVANTFAERWIGSIRRELLEQPKGLPRTIIWNRQQLERLVIDYIAHHNQHRPHQSLDQRPPTPIDKPPDTPPATVMVLRTSRCDGLIHEYRNAA